MPAIPDSSITWERPPSIEPRNPSIAASSSLRPTTDGMVAGCLTGTPEVQKGEQWSRLIGLAGLTGKWLLAYHGGVGDVFKALADPTRRAILDELQDRN